MKYLLAGALMVVSGSAMAQSFDEAVKAVKSGQSPKEVESLVKDVKDWKKNAAGLAKVGRAYLDVKDTLNTRKYANLAVDAEKKLKEGKTAVGYILLGDLEVYNDNPGDAAVGIRMPYTSTRRQQRHTRSMLSSIVAVTQSRLFRHLNSSAL